MELTKAEWTTICRALFVSTHEFEKLAITIAQVDPSLKGFAEVHEKIAAKCYDLRKRIEAAECVSGELV